MKRMHVNLVVADLEASIQFYTSLFDAQPSALKEDYAKWMLEDPRVNFAISTHGCQQGVDHLGIQVENEDELGEVFARLKSAGAPILEQGDTSCCYSRSKKNWIFDPEGIPWETFMTKGESPVYGETDAHPDASESVCCVHPDIPARQAGASSSGRSETISSGQSGGCCS